MMAEISSTTRPPEMNSSASPPVRTLNRLHKRPTIEMKKSSRLLGVTIKRISEYEPVSNCSRGTLGGFLPLCDVGSGSSDDPSLEKEKAAEKECVLTQLTKKIGLGIYTRARGARGESDDGLADGHIEEDGGERETWYMFYPPPPSPSLALEPKKCNSISSSDVECEPQSQPASEVASYAKSENALYSLPSTPIKESLHAGSQLSPTTEEHLYPSIDNQNVDVDALIASAEHLAEQYRDLLLPEDIESNPITSYTGSHDHDPPNIFPILVPVSDFTPKTIRKVKRQHSLRKLIDLRRSQFLNGPSSSVPTLITSHSSVLSPVTSPITPSGTSFVFPFSPASMKSDTPSSPSRSKQTKCPEPPPRDSSLGHTSKKPQVVEIEVLPSSSLKRQWVHAYRLAGGEGIGMSSNGDVKSQPYSEGGVKETDAWRRFGMVGVEDGEGQWWL